MRIAARSKLLHELNISWENGNDIRDEIRLHITHARQIINRLLDTNDDRLELLFLRECMIIWLLGSEPASLRLALKNFFLRKGASIQSNTSFFAMILKMLGYSRNARRKLSRDATAVEFAMTQGMTPSSLLSYFQTQGQGRDATYRRAIGRGAPRNAIRRHVTRHHPKALDRIEKLSPGSGCITFTKRTPTGSTVQSCLVDRRKVKAVISYIRTLKQID